MKTCKKLKEVKTAIEVTPIKKHEFSVIETDVVLLSSSSSTLILMILPLVFAFAFLFLLCFHVLLITDHQKQRGKKINPEFVFEKH